MLKYSVDVHKKVILLLEADAVIRELVTDVLEREYRVLSAERYSTACRLWKEAVDLFLIDYMLPDKNGIEVLRALRERNPSVPAVLMTAYGSEHLAIRALRAGAADYIKKPFSLRYLLSRIADILKSQTDSECSGDEGKEEWLREGIAEFIGDNYRAKISRADVARKLCMNESKFSKLFNRKFDRGFKMYLNDLRVKEAESLLRNNTDLTITEIAASVGYESITYFERVFRHYNGVSPRQYRLHAKDPM
jgi:two-component system, response regulator YesN